MPIVINHLQRQNDMTSFPANTKQNLIISETVHDRRLVTITHMDMFSYKYSLIILSVL